MFSSIFVDCGKLFRRMFTVECAQKHSAIRATFALSFVFRFSPVLLSVSRSLLAQKEFSKHSSFYIFFLAHCLKDIIKEFLLLCFCSLTQLFQLLAHIAVIIFCYIALPWTWRYDSISCWRFRSWFCFCTFFDSFFGRIALLNTLLVNAPLLRFIFLSTLFHIQTDDSRRHQTEEKKNFFSYRSITKANFSGSMC